MSNDSNTTSRTFFPVFSFAFCVVSVSFLTLLCPGFASAAPVESSAPSLASTQSWAQVSDQSLHGEAALQSYFPDANDSNAWFYASVHRAADEGLITGYDNGFFGPADTLTRAQAAVILWRYYTGGEGSTEPNYTGMSDVSGYDWYVAAANWAVGEGVISGKEQADGSRLFDPTGPITREQLCAIVANAAEQYAGAEVDNPSMSSFYRMPDYDSVGKWARSSVAWSLNEGVISGKESGDQRVIDPGSNVTRAEMAAILMNAIDEGLLGDASASFDWQSYLSSGAWKSTFPGISATSYSYTLVDLDGDGVDELLICCDTSDRLFTYSAIFKYSDGRVVVADGPRYGWGVYTGWVMDDGSTGLMVPSDTKPTTYVEVHELCKLQNGSLVTVQIYIKDEGSYYLYKNGSKTKISQSDFSKYSSHLWDLNWKEI